MSLIEPWIGRQDSALCSRSRHGLASAQVLFLLLAVAGCHQAPYPKAPLLKPLPPVDEAEIPADVPRELSKVSLPTYIVEPPDILLIDAVRVIPRAPYRLEPGDQVAVQTIGIPPDQTIDGLYLIGPDGSISLGPYFGQLPIAGLTPLDASTLLNSQLKLRNNVAQGQVSLAQSRTRQEIAGEHLVAPDGTVTLGVYGSVYVAGYTLADARAAIEGHLTQYLEQPEVSVDVLAYNSKVYYVITEGAGYGDRVFRFPVTGNDTVLDAISQVQGLAQFSSKKIWVARPSPHGVGCCQVLPVDWEATIKCASTMTNYQLMPGDRVFIAQDRLVAFDSKIAKLLTPFERMFGFTLLGTETVQSINRFPKGFGVGGFGGF
jgi:polysaccharide export outer membrane protein